MSNSTDTGVSLDQAQQFISFFLILLKTSAEASLKVYGQILIGLILSHPKINFINKTAVGYLSKILLYASLPMLVFLKFGSAINFELLTQVLVAPIAGLSVTIFQFILGQLLFLPWKKILPFLNKGEGSKEKKEKKKVPRHMLVLSIMFNNYIVIPYAFVMAFTEAELFRDPEKDSHGIAFITLYYFPVVALFFSFGMWYTSTDPTAAQKEVVKPTVQQSKTKRIIIKVLALLKKFFPPTIIAMILGLVIGIFKPLKEFFFISPPPIVSVLPKVCGLFAGSVLPIAFLIAGGNIGRILWAIYAPQKKEGGETKDEMEMEEKKETKKGVWEIIKKYWIIKHNSAYTCVASVVGKLIISPLCVFGVLAFFCLVFPEFIIADKTMLPLMCMAIVIEASCPMTLLLASLTSLYESGEKETAELLLLHHIVFPFTMVALCVLYLFFFCWISSPYGCIGF